MPFEEQLEITINSNSTEPKYYQLYSQLKNHIASGLISPGERLPSERFFAEKLDLHRNTVRKAIQDLISEGICLRRIGVGVFIAEERIKIDMQASLGISRRVLESGHQIRTKVLENKILEGPSEIHTYLKIPSNTSILRLKRLRLVDEEPTIYETTHLPVYRFPGIEAHDFQGSLYTVIRNEYGVTPIYAKGQLRYNLADRGIAQLLNLPINSAVFEKIATVYSSDGSPVEYVHGFYRSDRVEFIYYVGHPQ